MGPPLRLREQVPVHAHTHTQPCSQNPPIHNLLTSPAPARLHARSQSTLNSLEWVDEEQINYDLLAALVAYIVDQQRVHGMAACMDGWEEGLQGLKKVGLASTPFSQLEVQKKHVLQLCSV